MKTSKGTKYENKFTRKSFILYREYMENLLSEYKSGIYNINDKGIGFGIPYMNPDTFFENHCKVQINKKAKVSFIEQETVLENEKISIKDYLKDKTGLSDDFIEAAIDSLYNHEPEFRDKRIFMLSGGEKKRLEIFAHILADTHLLIIDEPSTYMDDYSRNTIADMLSEYSGAVILVTHDKALLRKIDFTLYDIRDKRFRIKN